MEAYKREAQSRIRIVTRLDVRMYKCTGRKYTDHGVMCVITRYGQWRLKVDWLNKDNIKKNDNITSELNDCSFESNSCGAEKERSEYTRTGGCKGRVHFLNNAKRKERVTTTKQKSKLKKYLLAGEGRRRDKMKIRNKIHRAEGTHFLDGMK